MRVLEDAERGFRVEGLFELPLTTDARDHQDPGRLHSMVAGACNARVTTLPVSLLLPVSGHVEHVAA
jgi:hypothetical protein